MFIEHGPFGDHIIEPITAQTELGEKGKGKVEEIFHDLIRRLRVRFPIDRAVLILGNRTQTEYHATAEFENGRCRKNLSIRLPGESSLIRQVAEGGCLYTESFCAFFSGNELEKKLLMDAKAQAFALVPLKSEGRVVGLIGFSSHDPHAFSLFEEGVLGNACEMLGRQVAAGLK